MNTFMKRCCVALLLAVSCSTIGTEVAESTNSTSGDVLDVMLQHDLHLLLVVNEQVGTVSIKLILEQPQGWIGFGRTSGGMIGGEVVIGFPGDTSSPALYRLSYKSMSGLRRLSDSEQEFLHERSITQNATHTVLQYTTPLATAGFLPIVGNGENRFLWAVGSSNVLSLHRSCNEFNANLARPGGGSTTMNTNMNYRVSVVHGFLTAIAWAILVPMAVASSMLRDLLPDGMWFILHRLFNVVAMICTVVAFAIAVQNVSDGDGHHFRGVTHRTVGLVVFMGAVVQAAGGLIRPHFPESQHLDGSCTYDENEDSEVDANHGRQKKNLNSKVSTRSLWVIGHRCFGLCLLGLGWYSCYTGINVFLGLYPNQKDLRPVLCGVIGACCGTTLTLYIFTKAASAWK